MKRKRNSQPTWKHWTTEDHKRMINMRKAGVHPQIIAETLGRTKGSIELRLSQSPHEFPKLKRPDMKWDKAAVARWREKIRSGKTRIEIQIEEKVAGSTMSNRMAKDLYNELA